jgi:hypothetical protein
MNKNNYIPYSLLKNAVRAQPHIVSVDIPEKLCMIDNIMTQSLPALPRRIMKHREVSRVNDLALETVLNNILRSKLPSHCQSTVVFIFQRCKHGSGMNNTS